MQLDEDNGKLMKFIDNDNVKKDELEKAAEEETKSRK